MGESRGSAKPEEEIQPLSQQRNKSNVEDSGPPHQETTVHSIQDGRQHKDKNASNSGQLLQIRSEKWAWLRATPNTNLLNTHGVDWET